MTSLAANFQILARVDHKNSSLQTKGTSPETLDKNCKLLIQMNKKISAMTHGN